MANPTIVSLTANAWTKVATDVTSGNLHFKYNAYCSYFHTYRLTGESAPTDRTDEVLVAELPSTVPISAIEKIDVYVYCFSSVDADGEVRVAV